MEISEENNGNGEFEFLNLSDFVRNSILLFPEKEEFESFVKEKLLSACAYWIAGETEKASDCFADISTIDPTNFYPVFFRLIEGLKSKNYDALMEDLHNFDVNTIKSISQFQLYLLIKAVLEYSRFDITDCIQTCNTALKYDSSDSILHFMLANCQMLRHMYYPAIEHYLKALKGDVYKNEINTNLAYAYQRIGKFRKARRLYKKVITIFPKSFKIPYGLAICNFNLGRMRKSLFYLQVTEKNNPTFSGTFLTRGAVFLKQGNIAGARNQFEKAICLGSTKAKTQITMLDLKK